MKKQVFFVAAACCLALTPLQSARAVDHNNLDAGRPLEFDDAYSIAYREQALEFGAAISKPAHGKTGVQGSAEYLYGFAKNSHFSLDFDPSTTAEEGERRRLDAGDIGLGVFHNFNREHGSTPALALRADAFLPTGRDSQGVDFRVRGIATKQFGSFGRVHLNLDWAIQGGTRDGERKHQPGVILGYSQPIGYPTRFDRTLLAQVGYRANPLQGENGIATIGLGLRQQVGVQSVFDIGVLSDLSGGDAREKWKVTAGYSRQF